MNKVNAKLEKALLKALDVTLNKKLEIEKKIEMFEQELKSLNQMISDYRSVLNHTRGSKFSLNKKVRNTRFQSSPRQLVAHILKQQPDRWFNTNEIVCQAMILDSQTIKESVPRLHLQTIHSTLNHLMRN